jgi:hypothetical protein
VTLSVEMRSQLPEAVGPQAPTSHAEEVVRAACQELQVLRKQRADIMKRISTVKQTIVGLAALFDGLITPEDVLGMSSRKTRGRQVGLTNACRMALMQSQTSLRSHQVRERLRAQGLSLDQHKDPIATVTTILNRLVDYGEAQSVVLADGKRAWQWAAESSAVE